MFYRCDYFICNLEEIVNIGKITIPNENKGESGLDRLPALQILFKNGQQRITVFRDDDEREQIISAIVQCLRIDKLI